MGEQQIVVRLNPDCPPTGSCLGIVNAARRSFGKRSEWDYTDPINGKPVDPKDTSYEYLEICGKSLKPKDKRLLEFLARGMTADDFEDFINNVSIVGREVVDGGWEDCYVYDLKELLWQWRNTPTHDTPFNHGFFSFEVKAPIFVARHLVKHEYLIMSEYSRRYITEDVEFYSPNVWRTKPEGDIKQGSGTSSLQKPEIKSGFCLNCGKEICSSLTSTSGGPLRKYCSDKCKYECNNKHRNPYKTVFQNAKARVLREGGAWEIDFDTFDFPEYCPYLGYKLDYSYGKGKIQHNSPSFDQINAGMGYVDGNVRIVSNRANSMKNDAEVEDQVKMAKAVLLRHKGYVVQEDNTYEGVCKKSQKLYQSMVEDGYSAEQARMVLPQSLMTSWTWSGTLGAFANMCKLRLGKDTQAETRYVAEKVYEELKRQFPVAAPLLVEGVY